MPTFDDYRRIDIDIDGANDWIPEIRLSGGDVEGRTIQVRLLKDGKVIDDPTAAGTTTLTARLLFNPKIGTAYPGGYKTMSKFVEDSTTGESTWGFETTVPRAAFTNLTGSHTTMAIEVQKSTGTGDSAKDEIVCSRTFNAVVDESVLKAGDGTDPDPLEEWHDLINHGDTQVQDVVDRGNQAIATFNTDGQNAIDAFNTKGNEAVDAFKTKSDAAVTKFDTDSTAKLTKFDTDSAAKLTNFDTDSTTAINGVNTVKDSMQELVDNANVTAGTVSELKPNEVPTFELTGDKWDKTVNLGLPRGASIAAVTASTLPAGQEATATSTKNADGDYEVELGVPTGPQGVDGFPVFVAPRHITQGLGFNKTELVPQADEGTNYTKKALLVSPDDGALWLAGTGIGQMLYAGTLTAASLKGPAGDASAPATADKAGVVKPGFGLEVDSEGTLALTAVTPPVEGDFDVAKIHGNDTTGAGVLIDRTKGLVSTDAGVAVNLSENDPGLEFDAAGGLKATAQAVGDATRTEKGVVSVGAGINVSNGNISLAAGYGLGVDDSDNTVHIKLSSGISGLRITNDDELELQMAEPPSTSYNLVTLTRTPGGPAIVYDTAGLDSSQNKLMLAPATPTILGGVKYDNNTIKLSEDNQLYSAVGFIFKVGILGTSYGNIAPRPICVRFGASSLDLGNLFGFYVNDDAISFNSVDLALRKADGGVFDNTDFSAFATLLNGKYLTDEKRNATTITATVSNAYTISLTLGRSLTVSQGPHWFEIS